MMDYKHILLFKMQNHSAQIYPKRKTRKRKKKKYTKSVIKISLSLLCQWHFNNFTSNAL